jgi:hypothetical protein
MKILIVTVALALGLVCATSAQAVPADAAFVSPTHNLVCLYANQYGVGCKSLNNGRSAILRAYTGVVTFRGWVRAGDPWAARVIPYGRTATYGGTFKVRSSPAGLDVWSTLTGHGFHIDRARAWRF